MTHDLEEALALADEVIVLSAGPASRIVSRHVVRLERPRDLSSSAPRARSSICTGLSGPIFARKSSRANGVSAVRDRHHRAARATVLAWQLAVAAGILRRVGMGRPREAPRPVLSESSFGDCRARSLVAHKRIDLGPSDRDAGGGASRARRRRGSGDRLRLRPRSNAAGRPHCRSVYQDAECGAARRAGAAVPALVWPRYLVEGGARGHARLLRDVLQHVSRRSRRGSRDHRQRSDARRVGTPAGQARAGAERVDVDLFEPSNQPRIRDGGRGCGRVSGRRARTRATSSRRQKGRSIRLACSPA